MNIDAIRSIIENKLTSLNTSLATATANGDISSVMSIEAEILETQESLRILNIGLGSITNQNNNSDVQS